MANESGLSIDSKIARANLRALHKAGMDAKQPVFEGVIFLKYLADEKEPKTPFRDGQLKSETEMKVTQKGDEYIGTLWYLMPYAARWHFVKVPINWSEPGSGPNYLGAKLTRYSKEILEVIATAIEKKLKAAVR